MATPRLVSILFTTKGAAINITRDEIFMAKNYSSVFTCMIILYGFALLLLTVSQVSPAQIWVASWMCELSGYQLDEPMGLSGGIEQQTIISCMD